MEFNHDENSVYNALNIPKNRSEFASMCADYALEFLEGDVSVSKLAESIHNKSDYNEILLLATFFILKGIKPSALSEEINFN